MTPYTDPNQLFRAIQAAEAGKKGKKKAGKAEEPQEEKEAPQFQKPQESQEPEGETVVIQEEAGLSSLLTPSWSGSSSFFLGFFLPRFFFSSSIRR